LIEINENLNYYNKEEVRIFFYLPIIDVLQIKQMIYIINAGCSYGYSDGASVNYKKEGT